LQIGVVADLRSENLQTVSSNTTKITANGLQIGVVADLRSENLSAD